MIQPISDLEIEERNDREYPAFITEPQRGFLKAYVTYASKCTDAPLIFHLSCGLTLLSTAVGNRLYIPAWGEALRLNLWTVLVAASSFFRKTQSIKIALRILRNGLPDALYPDSFSIERIQQVMARKPCGLLVAYELAELWGGLRREYMAGGLGFFLRLYDSEEKYVRETLGSGKLEIINPALSLLCATTPDWMMGAGMKSEDVTAGGLPRFLIVPALRKEREMTYTAFRDPLMEAELGSYLGQLGSHAGKLELSPAASSIFNGWTDRMQRSVAKGDRPRELQPFYSRLQTMALKIAGLYYLSAPEGPAITAAHMDASVTLVRHLAKQTATLLTESVSYSQEGHRSNLVLKALREASGRMTHAALTNRVKQHMGARQLTEALQVLSDGQRVKDFVDRSGGTGRPPRIIELVEVED